MNIAFVHPDLGIGGAERLVVDAAVGLKKKGHKITMFTNYHDKKRCFDETRDGTLKVKVYGNYIPRHFCGFFHIFFSIIRMIYCCFRIVLSGEKYDVFVVDQVSACVPVLKWFTKSKVLFYCHFPDKLLAQNRKKFFKRIYRWPFDFIEEKTTNISDLILVNSKFTRKTFKKHFKSIKTVPEVLYPTLNGEAFDKVPDDLNDCKELIELMKNNHAIVSINRFERKKNIKLAVQMFADMKTKMKPEEFSKCVLILAGGYDERLKENRDYMKELMEIVKEKNLEKQTKFMKSFSNTEKYVLLHNAVCITYTPENEHFGIVPIEAQYCSCPVIACNSGGPLESVENEVTGYLVPPKPELWADALIKLLKNENRKEIGEAGRKRVESMFTLDVFSEKMNEYVTSLFKKEK